MGKSRADLREEDVAQEKKTDEQVQMVVTSLSNEEYGIPIMQVQEIIKIPEITRIPNMPDFIEGVINLRGKIVPVIDLRKRFNLQQHQHSEDTRIVVSTIETNSVGLIVDSVSEVIRLSSSVIDPIPPAISHIGTEYLNGVGKLDSRLIILLNLEKILSDLEKSSLKRIETEKTED